ncbi:MAG TPA: hypothetical protein VFQ92_08545 [Blastocatellia bacterium]|nr:hypothetical protein [Blastocatellia bacterium]
MTSLHQTVTVAFKQCRNCDGHLLAPDNFCRWCGVRQTRPPDTAANSASECEHKTRHMQDDAKVELPFSSLSLDTLAQKVTAKTGSLRLNRLGVLVIAVLVAIPMWLLIILLSPLDAYASARAVSNQMGIQ